MPICLCPRSRSTLHRRKESEVVEFPLIRDDVGIDAARRGDVVVTYELPDPRPRHPGEVQQRDAPVPQITR